MSSTFFKPKAVRGSLVGLASIAACLAAQAAVTFEIASRDGPGVGFNDPTVVAPVGGNPKITLGEQRQFVYQYVAGIWGAALTSAQKVTVNAAWQALTCTAGSAVLGSASAWNGWRDFPNAPKPGTWYHQALANKLAAVGQSLADFYGQPDDGSGYGNVDIVTQFNVNLGQATCLAGSPFYLGVDGSPPAGQINFVEVLLHELAHGLGFSLFTTSSATGAQFDGKPSIWEHFMADNSTGKKWVGMTDAERVASTVNFRALGWDGSNTNAAVPLVLKPGATPVPRLVFGGPAAGSFAGRKVFGTAGFGAQLFNVSKDVMPVVDQVNGTGLACTASLSAANAAAVNGRIALIDRGACGFAVKTKTAQNAGAVGVIIANSVAGVIAMGGADPTITIPALMISLADANALKLKLARRTRTSSGVVGMMTSTVTGGAYVGTDALNRALLYTPNPRIGGSSVSHWDTIATPNLLMEPNINADLGIVLGAPKDLTLPLLQDLGW